MKPYKSSAPRAAFAFAAIAMTAITIAIAIFVPANIDSGASRLSESTAAIVATDEAAAAVDGFARKQALAVDAASSSEKLHATNPARRAASV